MDAPGPRGDDESDLPEVTDRDRVRLITVSVVGLSVLIDKENTELG